MIQTQIQKRYWRLRWWFNLLFCRCLKILYINLVISDCFWFLFGINILILLIFLLYEKRHGHRHRHVKIWDKLWTRNSNKLMIIEIKIVENILWGKKSWRCWKISDLWLWMWFYKIIVLYLILNTFKFLIRLTQIIIVLLMILKIQSLKLHKSQSILLPSLCFLPLPHLLHQNLCIRLLLPPILIPPSITILRKNWLNNHISIINCIFSLLYSILWSILRIT